MNLIVKEKKIIEFYEKNNIPYHYIWYFIKNDTKTPINEYNKAEILDIKNTLQKQIKTNYEITIPTSYKVNKKYIKLTEKDKESLKLCVSGFVKHTPNIYVIDIDDETIKSPTDLPNIFSKLYNSIYINGNTKGIHIYVKINGLDEYSCQQDVLKHLKGDLIRQNNIWERCDKSFIYGNDFNVIELEWNDIKHWFDLIKMNFKNNNDDNTIKTTDLYNLSKPIHFENDDNSSIVSSLTDIENKNKIDLLQFRKYIDGLSVERSDNYNYWTKVIWGIYNTSKENKWSATTRNQIIHTFSKKSSKYDESIVDEFIENNIKDDKEGIGVGTIINYYKEDNPTKNIDKKNYELMKFCNNDNEASIHLFNLLKDKFKSCNGRLFYLDKNIWVCDEEMINNVVLQYVMNSNIYLSNDKNKIIPYAQNVSKAKKIMEALYSKIKVDNNDDALYKKFHSSTKGKICFNDGVLDFVNKKFIKWDSDELKNNPIYSTVKIDRDYEYYFNNPNMKDIKDITDKIFTNLYGDKKDLALNFLSRALAGHHEDKRWASYLGNRNCGKGVEYDLLSEAFQKYVNTFELGNMLYCRKTTGMENVDCSKKLYWLIDLEFTRLAISQEIPENKSGMVINGKMLKKITGGGDTIVARRNYDRKDTYFNLDTTFYIKGNYSLECDSTDCNSTKIEFSSVVQFKTEEEINILKSEGRTELEMKRYKIADTTIKDKCKTLEWSNAVIYLIYENYKNKSVACKKDVEIEDNDILKAIEDNFEITNKDEDIIQIKDVYNILEGLDKGKITDELQSLNVFKKKYQNKDINKISFLNKFCFYGIKQK